MPTPHKITLPDGSWVNLRSKQRRFKAGERRALYELFDKLEGGEAVKTLTLVRHMAAHLIEDWSLDLPRPQAELKNGQVLYENMESLDEIDCAMEDEILAYAGEWLKQISINLNPSREANSPTEPSGA